MNVLIAILSLFSVVVYFNIASADDFQKAFELIKKQKPNIDYNSFCSETPGGEEKIACRIKKVPTIALLVCKKAKYEEGAVSCEKIITNEINNLKKVKQAKLDTVDFKSTIITPLKCAEQTRSTECVGYLVRWVQEGKFANLDDTIYADNVAVLANQLIQYIDRSKLPTTRSAIKEIINFMQPGAGKYSRICDLQGFFLKKGGFLINDVPSFEEKVTIKPTCGGSGEKMPTYNEVISGLTKLVELLK